MIYPIARDNDDKPRTIEDVYNLMGADLSEGRNGPALPRSWPAMPRLSFHEGAAAAATAGYPVIYVAGRMFGLW